MKRAAWLIGLTSVWLTQTGAVVLLLILSAYAVRWYVRQLLQGKAHPQLPGDRRPEPS